MPARFRSAVLNRAGCPSSRLAALLAATKPKRKLKTEEHDAQVALFKEHILPRKVGAVSFAIANGGKRDPKVAKSMQEASRRVSRTSSGSTAARPTSSR
ncbi:MULTISPECIES: hypothetical protein [Bradyrhizobium]|uniref:hypothetical protein n=1 Tax=Bradyrhizobium TaxID=374 RepID=UPI001EDC89BC|nr:hypothetical protein [Bradyrhizobium zhengyangense]MCG2645719.1 hypothetical protein [Bradyrhizobium zhengyangense]